MADFAKYAKSTGGTMTEATLRTKGTYTITCEWDVVPSNWVQEQILALKNGNGIDFKRDRTFIVVETHPAINVPTALCYNLLNRLEPILHITEVHFYAHGAIAVSLGVVIEVNESSACMRAEQLQSLGHSEFMACAIVEDFVEQHPVE